MNLMQKVICLFLLGFGLFTAYLLIFVKHRSFQSPKVNETQDSLPSMQSQLSENLGDSQSDSAPNSKEERR